MRLLRWATLFPPPRPSTPCFSFALRVTRTAAPGSSLRGTSSLPLPCPQRKRRKFPFLPVASRSSSPGAVAFSGRVRRQCAKANARKVLGDSCATRERCKARFAQRSTQPPEIITGSVRKDGGSAKRIPTADPPVSGAGARSAKSPVNKVGVIWRSTAK